MRTIAIWYDRKECSESTPSLDIHINLWRIKHPKIIDFGFMLKDGSNVEKINIFLPFKVDKEDINDLGKILNSDNELVRAIFNDNYTGKEIAVNSKSHKFSYRSDEFCTYEISFNDDMISHDYEGTIIKIDLSKADATILGKCYLRFRIKCKEIGPVIYEQHEKWQLFSSAITKTEVIDFRINEDRNYPKDLREIIQNEFSLKKVHFLIMTNSNDLFNSNNADYSCRSLEPELWNDYINNNKLDNMVAYHLKTKAERDGSIDSFNSLVTIKYRHTSIIRILVYLAFIILLELLSNAIYDWLR